MCLDILKGTEKFPAERRCCTSHKGEGNGAAKLNWSRGAFDTL